MARSPARGIFSESCPPGTPSPALPPPGSPFSAKFRVGRFVPPGNQQVWREPHCHPMAACSPPVTNRAEPGRRSHSASSRFPPGTHIMSLSTWGTLGGGGDGAEAMPGGQPGPPRRAKMWGCWACLWGFSVWKSLGAEVMRETEAYLFMHLDVQAIGHLIVLQGGEEGMSGTKGSLHTSQHSLCPPIHGVFSCSSRPLPQSPKTPQRSLQGSTCPHGG